MNLLRDVQWKPLLTLAPPFVMGAVTLWFEISNGDSLTAREQALIQAVQFVASVWIGWSVSYYFANVSFRDQQRKFALSAYRRISELDYALDRLLSRTRTRGSAGKAGDWQTISEIALLMRYTTNSSKADWADIIGSEMNLAESIKKPDVESDPGRNDAMDRIEKLLQSLPASLAIQTRQNIEDRVEHWVTAFRNELASTGHIELEGFWDRSFQVDPWSLPRNARLQVFIDDVGDRVAALIAHDKEGRSVGVVVNATDELDYDEFMEALRRATRKGAWSAVFVNRGLHIIDPNEPAGERRYFDLRLIQEEPGSRVPDDKGPQAP